ncbi:MAG TPA: aldose epimerase family protein [Clostridia bacterium]|nr:aldose epimerase family protein [Clostridia bacterium]
MKLRKLSVVLALSMAIIFVAAGCQRKPEAKLNMEKRAFGKTAEGAEVSLYVLTNKNGVEAAITNFGGALVSLKAPDRTGKLGDVILGYENVDGYVNDTFFFGGTIGRYGNRIKQGQFKLNGTTYTLAKNNGANHLHGGVKGFNKVLWEAKDVSTADVPALQLSYTSKDGEEGYPGNLSVQVTFTLTDSNELKIDYAATTDKDTIVNLTNHAYFNLAGQGDILQHQLRLAASRFTPVDATLIPTGELREVKGTPFDFTVATAIGDRINQKDEQLKFGEGYDHNFVLDASTEALPIAAEVYEPTTGRTLTVSTTEPGIQFYSGNFLTGTAPGKGGNKYPYRTGFCLETQHFPDSPNQPAFPSTVLKAGDQYKSSTVYKFSAK